MVARHISNITGFISKSQNGYEVMESNYIIFKILCCSNTSNSIGSFTFPTGDRKTDHYDTYIKVFSSDGCARLFFYRKPSYYGIYTCSISDDLGHDYALNIGVYDESYSCKCKHVGALFEFVSLNKFGNYV